MQIPEKFTITKADLAEIQTGVDYDRNVLRHLYADLYRETEDYRVLSQMQRVVDCHNLWVSDYYRFQHVKVVKHINLCKNRFCPNCQALLARSREEHFRPVLERLSEEYDLYHLALTQDNVLGFDLKDNISDIFKAFGKLVRYFRGNAKVKGVDFSEFGFFGAIRNLEITHNPKTGEYHPHLHCIFVLRKGLKLEKTIENVFSYDYAAGRSRIFRRNFSSLEILIQKLWYLILNNTTVNQQNVNSLKQGYSCILDKVENGEYSEVFKYAVKVKYDDLARNAGMFRILHDALRSKRVLQGYGALLNFADSIDETVDESFYKVEAVLREVEEPIEVCDQLEALSEEVRLNSKMRLLTKRKIFNALNSNEFELKLSPFAEKLQQDLLLKARQRREWRKLGKELRKAHEKYLRDKFERAPVVIASRVSEIEEAYTMALSTGFSIPLEEFIIMYKEIYPDAKYWKRITPRVINKNRR